MPGVIMADKKDTEKEEVEKEIIRHTSVKYRGDYFSITVSDRDKVTIENKQEDSDYDGIRRWILKHMHALDVVPPAGDEGNAFQRDLKKFMYVLGAGE